MTNSADKTHSGATSPAASGPAGLLFEGQVGAHYLLSMLAGGEPRGLPGTVVNRVEFQRAPEGRALDDVIVHATDRQGKPAVLEIQAKRTVDFTPSDPVFRSVVAQLAKAAARDDFDTVRYELAVAIERTSTKIERAYQEVLSWARHLGSFETFAAHIARKGQSNEDMRGFVETFRNNLEHAGAPDNDAAVWRILRRFQILVFDFNQQGSASELLARERAAMLLASQDISRAPDLWVALVNAALVSAVKGGDHTVLSLRETLKEFGYHWAGDRQLAEARRALDEASNGALADIRRHVGNVRIDRAGRLAEIYAALDAGHHFIEIRGDAGVGKSGILKQLAEQIRLEGRAVVLSPDRTIAGGWVSLRTTLNCDSSAREFLSDLASDGAAILFIDGVDFFDDETRRVTVRDLVRAAADVPNFSVVVTARRNFGVDDPSWLPADALDRLGQAPHVVIDDLNESEIAQLKAADSSLAALLADTHPARDVVRNLFRLARLARQTSTEPVPLTEADMAEQWWRSADETEAGRRERFRLLKLLAIHALTESGPMNVDSYAPTAIESMVASGSLRELRTDLVVFPHDVLRDWAIGCLLYDELARIADLPLCRPAPATLVRGIELAARLLAERAAEGEEWNALIDRLSQAGVHGSWRRTVLLAVVRSELGGPLLDRVSTNLFANEGALLQDLIRLTVAVDSMPGAVAFDDAGIDTSLLPSDFLVPTAPSWSRLVIWSLSVMPHIPKTVIPDLVDLYSRWSMATFGLDPLTPQLLVHFHAWLVEMESALHPDHYRDLRRPFGINLPSVRARDLETQLRMSFLAFCRRTPELAEGYLRSVAMRQAGDQIAHAIMKFRGSAAQAAPAALVDLALRTLIPKPGDDDELHSHRDRHRPFGIDNINFMPASPTQGPFFELLEHAPSEGLRLVREIVDHAIKYYSNGRDSGTDHFVIPFPDGDRAFPWVRSYIWARNSSSYIVASALMALEAWSHRRIEAGQPFGEVLADVLGLAPAPAAFLLVAVDLLLSHWPESKDSAWPFLACPELLSWDRTRYGHDSIDPNQMMAICDSMGLGELSRVKEPAGPTTLQALRQRPSRRISLDVLIGQYVLYGPPEILAALRVQLLRAAKRLGPPGNSANDMGYPRFAASHAMNLADPSNWNAVTFKQPDGSQGIGYRYQAPVDEMALLEPGQAKSRAALKESNLLLALATALDDRSKSSPDLIVKGVAWAQTCDGAVEEPDDHDAAEWRARTKVIAAALAMRDGDDILRATNAAWARATFAEALNTPDDPVHSFQTRLAFNVVAITTVGLISLLRHQPKTGDIRTLLEIAARSEPLMAHAFGAEVSTLNDIDERLPRSILRVGFAACIHALRNYDEPKEALAVRVEAHRRRVSEVLEQEIAWLKGGQPEPAWPEFPVDPPHPKRSGLRIPTNRTNSPSLAPYREWQRPLDAVAHQGAALWLRMSVPFVDAASMHWLRDLIKYYAAWTAVSNGVGLPDEDDPGHALREWNGAYFELVARTMVGLSPDEADHFALDQIKELPDEPFFHVMSQFIRTIDDLYFNGNQIEITEAVRIRSVLAMRLVRSRNWNWVTQENSSGIEVRIAPAIAALFMHDYSFIGTQCYLLPKGAERLDGFMLILADLTVQAARSSYVAILFLNLIEVHVQPQHLGYLVRCAEAWMASYPNDTTFWVDLGVGQRVCFWLAEVIRVNPNAFISAAAPIAELDRLLDAMLRIGVAQAKPIEEALARLRQG